MSEITKRIAVLKPNSKRVIDAFIQQRGLEGKSLYSDGRSLWRTSFGAEKIAVWRGPKIAVTSLEATNTAISVIRYLIKKAGKGLVTFSYDRPGFMKSLIFKTGDDVFFAGQRDGWIIAYVPWEDRPVGRLDWSLFEGEYQIKFVEVDPGYRRSGVATALYKKLFADQNITKRDLTPTMRTEEGALFRQHARLAAARYKNKKTVKNQDGKESVVYEYSDQQVKLRHREKAKKLEALRKGYNKLVKQVKADLTAKDEKTRLTALAVALINDTYERVGNESSAQEGHYGVTGWQIKHVTFGKGKPTIEYVGKSGVKQKKTVDDPDIAKALKACCKDRDGKESIFDTGGIKITSKAVNAYLKPFEITAKDLRGLAANQEMQRVLKEERKKGGKLPDDRKEREKQLKSEFKSALEQVAEIVGHTTSILRSSYLVPGLEDEYMKGGKVKTNLNKKAMAKRVVARHMARRVAVRWIIAEQTFEEAIKDKTFPSPETGEKVKFDSLPDEEQAKIRAQWSKDHGEEDEGGGGSVAKAKKTLGKFFSKINKKMAQPAVRTLGKGLGKAVGGIGKAVGTVVDRNPMNKLITVGGNEQEYGEAKNYRMMGKVIGNMFAPGSFEMSPEEEKVGKQYLAASAQAYLPVLKGVGYSGLTKTLLGGALAATLPGWAAAGLTMAAGLAVGAGMYKLIDKGWTKHWENKCKKDSSKCKDFDELTASIINGYDNIDKLEKEYEAKRKELEGQGDKLKELDEEWTKKQRSIDKAKGILSKYGSADQVQEGLKKQMTEMMTWAMEEMAKGLEDGSLTDDFLEEIGTQMNDVMKKKPDEIEKEAKEWE